MLNVKQSEILSPLARKVYHQMVQVGHITALDAIRSLGITSASLSRRICDLEEVGVKVKREKAKDPITGRAYTRYKVAA